MALVVGDECAYVANVRLECDSYWFVFVFSKKKSEIISKNSPSWKRKEKIVIQLGGEQMPVKSLGHEFMIV